MCFVDAHLEGQCISTLVDLGATHNYISAKKAKAMGLKVQPGTSSFKVVTSPTQNISGIIRDVPISVGILHSKMDMMAIEMDEFELVLGQEFLRIRKVAIIPHLESLMFMDPV